MGWKLSPETAESTLAIEPMPNWEDADSLLIEDTQVGPLGV